MFAEANVDSKGAISKEEFVTYVENHPEPLHLLNQLSDFEIPPLPRSKTEL
jgi:hypothetical protein